MLQLKAMKRQTLIDTIAPSDQNFPAEVNAIIEIPKGTSNKYELHKKWNIFHLDRALYGANHYPTDYGFVPQTLAEDGDPIDIMVVTTLPTFPGCLVHARVIGGLHVDDSGSRDTKIIAVNARNPRLDDIQEIDDLYPHFRQEIHDFWLSYSRLQPGKRILVKEWYSLATIKKLITIAHERYQNKHQK